MKQVNVKWNFRSLSAYISLIYDYSCQFYFVLQSISSHQVYVLQYPLLKGLGSPKQSVKSEVQKNSQLLKLTSPIAVLVSTYNREKRRYELEIVAIQINSNKREIILLV